MDAGQTHASRILNDGWLSATFTIIAMAFSLFHLYAGLFGAPEALFFRVIHLGFGLVLLCLVGILDAADKRAATYIAYGSLFLCAAIPLGYILLNYDMLVRGRFPYISGLEPYQVAFAVLLTLAVTELARRTMGIVIALLALFFAIYPFIGPWLPGVFHHNGYTLETFADGMAFSTDGIFGLSLGISASYVVLFILFAACLEALGFGTFMMAFCRGVAGTRRGGPAKIAVLGSAGLGTVTGSSIANVVATGALTIPLMRRTGFDRNFAGGVEAAASTGSQFMPPVMGAQAFIMAQFTGVPYITIVQYSLLPALLFYISIWVGVDLEARRTNLRGLTRDELGPWKREALERLHLLPAFFVLILMLVYGYTPTYAVVCSIGALLALSLLRRVTRPTPAVLLQALVAGARMSLPVIVATAVSGIIILSVTLTGLGSRFGETMVGLAQGNLTAGLVMAMFASIILGMGLPTVPAYIVQVGLVVPALVKMGLEPVVAHLFVVYFSCLSMITPPVALNAFAAAGISGGDPFKTGMVAWRLAAVGFIVPFMFCYDTSLLLRGDVTNVAVAVVSSVVGVIALSAALQGHFSVRLHWWERIAAGAGALCLVYPGFVSDLIGAVLVVVPLVTQYLRLRSRSPGVAADQSSC